MWPGVEEVVDGTAAGTVVGTGTVVGGTVVGGTVVKITLVLVPLVNVVAGEEVALVRPLEAAVKV